MDNPTKQETPATPAPATPAPASRPSTLTPTARIPSVSSSQSGNYRPDLSHLSPVRHSPEVHPFSSQSYRVRGHSRNGIVPEEARQMASAGESGLPPPAIQSHTNFSATDPIATTFPHLPSFLRRLLFSSNLAALGAATSPTLVATSLTAKHSIGFITLRLVPPARILHLRDVFYLFFNHSFLRLLLAIACLIVFGIFELSMEQISDTRYEGYGRDKQPLRDLLFDALPYIPDTSYVGTFLISMLLYTIAAFTLFSPDWETRFIVLRRWCFLMAWLYLFRGVTVVVTTIPSPLPVECIPAPAVLNGTVGQRLLYMLGEVAGSNSACTNNVFSGHSCVFTSCIMTWRLHSRLRLPFRLLAYCLGATGMLFIILTHFHYSLDVILAIFITYVSWRIYMACVDGIIEEHVLGVRRARERFQGEMRREYAFLAWQPRECGARWVRWVVMIVDGVDVRLRAVEAWGKETRVDSADTAAGDGTRSRMVDLGEMRRSWEDEEGLTGLRGKRPDISVTLDGSSGRM